MKKIMKGEMPDDFWNYAVNPILGYYVEPRDEQSRQDEKKYFKMPQGI